MKKFDFNFKNALNHLFGTHSNATSGNKKNTGKRHRTLRIEELESRDLLSATPFDDDYDPLHTFGNDLNESDLIYQNTPMPIAMAGESIIASGDNLTESLFNVNMYAPDGIASTTGLATLYLEYTNTGTTVMQAPILVLQATYNGAEGAKMTLDANLVYGGSATAFSSSLMIYADGATAGKLQPGETIWIPVYWVGWDGTIPNNAQIDFTLDVITADNTTLLDWELKTDLKPDSISNEAWDAVWNRLESLIGGNTWGDYVTMLGDIAAALHQTGNSKNTYTADELFGVAAQWANDAYNPFGTLVTATDVAVAGPIGTFQFTRTFIGTDIMSRYYDEGGLGYGWDHNWNIKLNVKSNGDVALQGSFGSERLFQKSGGLFVANSGGILSLSGTGINTIYTLTELDGTIFRFNSVGGLLTIADSHGNTVTATHTNGKLTKLADAFGNWMSIAYNTNGTIASVSGGNGDVIDNVTTYTYDTSGNLIKATNSKHNLSVSYAYATQTTGSLAHTLSTITYADGNVQHFTYNAAGTLVSSTINGMASLNIAEAGLMGYKLYEGTTLVQTIWFNSNGQIAKTENPEGLTAIYEYDHLGRVVKITEKVEYAATTSTTFEYDSKGNISRVVNADGKSLQFTYMAQGQISTFTDAKGNKTTFRYDAHGNLIGTDRVNGTFGSITYYENGQVHTVVNRRGESYTYTYDSTGRLIENKPSTAPNSILYEYDARGNLTKITDGDQVTTMTYNSQDLVTRVDYSGDKWIAYTYDAFGRQTSVQAGTIASGVDECDYHVAYTYTSLGLLWKVIDKMEGDKVVTEYQYDTQGRPVKEISGNGTFTTYTYNTLGSLLTKTDYANGTTVLSKFEYTYNMAGYITSMKTLDGTWTYSYDTIGQLLEAKFVSTNGDAEQRLKYVYDSMGNRIWTTERTYEHGIQTSFTETSYTHNAMNQCTQVSEEKYLCDAQGNILWNTLTQSTFEYQYDADGNMIVKHDKSTGEKWTFEWCQGNWLRASSQFDANGIEVERWEYEYDAFGNRIAVVHTTGIGTSEEQSKRTEYLIDLSGLGNVLAEYDADGNLVVSYFHGYGLTSQIDANGNMAYYGFDALGSTAIITNATGQVVNKYTYDPFGKTLSSTEGIDTPFQFAGQHGVRTGQHAELLDIRARWYDPSTGRFISEDPVGLAGGANLYAYTQNNPVNFIDPNGEARAAVDWVKEKYHETKDSISNMTWDQIAFTAVDISLGMLPGVGRVWKFVSGTWQGGPAYGFCKAIVPYVGGVTCLPLKNEKSPIQTLQEWGKFDPWNRRLEEQKEIRNKMRENAARAAAEYAEYGDHRGVTITIGGGPPPTQGGQLGEVDASGNIKFGDNYYNANDWFRVMAAGLQTTSITWVRDYKQPGEVYIRQYNILGGMVGWAPVDAHGVLRVVEIRDGYGWKPPIGGLNLSGLTALQSLTLIGHFNGYNLTSLNVSGCTKLESLNVSYNQLTSLNISGCTNLQNLNVSYNQLTSLSVSGFTKLQNLDAPNNQLTSLNISGCTNLKSLDASNNQLDSLNAGGLTKLESLGVSHNRLTVLSVSGCTALHSLIVDNNLLRSLNLTGTKIQSAGNSSYSGLFYSGLNVQYNLFTSPKSVSGTKALDNDLFHNYYFAGNPMENYGFNVYDGGYGPNGEYDGILFVSGNFSSALNANDFEFRYRLLGSNSAWTTIPSSAIPKNDDTPNSLYGAIFDLFPGMVYECQVILKGEHGGPNGMIFAARNVASLGVPYTVVETTQRSITLSIPAALFQQYSSLTLWYKDTWEGDSTYKKAPAFSVNGDIATVTITGLYPDGWYQFQLRQGSSTPFKSVWQQHVEAAPFEGIQLTASAATNSVTFTTELWQLFSEPRITSWYASDIAKDIKLQYREVGAATWTTGGTLSIGGTSDTSLVKASVAGLKSNTEYEFKLVYKGNDVLAEEKVWTKVAAPVKVAGLTGSSTFDSVTLTWTANDANKDFEVWYNGTKLGLENVTFGTSGGKPTATITDLGLLPGTSYTFSVVAVGAVGGDGIINTAAATSLTVKTATYPITILATTNSGISTVQVNWSAPVLTDVHSLNGVKVVPEYKIQVLDATGKALENHPDLGYTLVKNSADVVIGAAITGLKPNATYSVKITVFVDDNGEERTLTTATSTAKTATYAAVTINTPTTAQIGLTSVELSWKQGITGTEGYVVEVYAKGAVVGTADPLQVHYVDGIGNLACPISGLDSGAQYTFAVYATTATETEAIANGKLNRDVIYSAVATRAVTTATYTAVTINTPTTAQIGLTSVELSWKQGITGTEGYVVEVYAGTVTAAMLNSATPPTPFQEAYYFGGTTTLTGQITGLDPKTPYTFVVYATTATNENDALTADGKKINGAVLHSVAALRAVTTATYTAVTINTPTTAQIGLTSVELSWKQGVKDTAGYVVEVYAGTVTAAMLNSATPPTPFQEAYYFGGTTTLTGQITGLDPKTPYTFVVYATTATNENDALTADGKKINGTVLHSVAALRAVTTATYAAVGTPKVETTATSLTSVTLTWAAAPQATNTTSYEVTYTDAKGDVQTKIVLSNSNPTNVNGRVGIIITGLDPNTKYTFAIRAVAEVGMQTIKSVAANVPATTLTTYAAVKNLKAINKPSTAADTAIPEVTLTWDASPVAETTGYEVYLVVGNTQTLLGTVNTCNYTVGGNILDPGTKYTFAVRAIATVDGQTIRSNVASAAVTTPTYAAVASLTATVKETTVTLTWTHPAQSSTGTTGYEIYRVDGTTYVSIGTTTNLTYEIKNLDPGTKYTYAVRAIAGTGSDIERSVAKSVAVTTATYAAVAGFKVETGATNPDRPTETTVTLTWTAAQANTGTTGYEIYRVDGTVLTLVDTVVGHENTTSTVNNLNPGTSYTFTIRAVADVGGKEIKSVAAKNVTAKTVDTIAAITNLKVTTTTLTEATLTWAVLNSWTTATGTTRYEFYDATGNRIDDNRISFTDTTTAKISGLDPGTKYSFVVRAVGTKIDGGTEITSNPSSAVLATTTTYAAVTINAPTTAQIGLTSVDLSWKQGAVGTAGYVVEIYAGTVTAAMLNAGTATPLQAKYFTALNGQITGLDPKTPYTFVVYATTATETEAIDNGKLNSAVLHSVAATRTITTATYAAVGTPKVETTLTSLTSVTLTWAAAPQATNTDHYEVTYTDAKGVLQTKIVPSNSNPTNVNGRVGIIVTDLDPNTKYTFAIRAVSEVGMQTIKSVAANVTATTAKPVAIAGLRATAGVNAVALTWTESKMMETTGYAIFDEATGELLQTVNSTGTTGTVSTTIKDLGTGFSEGIRYSFIVVAVSGDLNNVVDNLSKLGSAGVSLNTSVNVTTLALTKYAAVAGLKATVPANTLGTVSLSWTASTIPDTVTYEVVMYGPTGDRTVLNSTQIVDGNSVGTMKMLSETGLLSGVYRFEVLAITDNGIKSAIASVSATVRA